MGKFRMPSAYTVLFLIILLMTALTWVIPSGAYDYGPDGEPIAGTYHRVKDEKQPLSWPRWRAFTRPSTSPCSS